LFCPFPEQQPQLSISLSICKIMDEFWKRQQLSIIKERLLFCSWFSHNSLVIHNLEVLRGRIEEITKREL